MKYRFTFFCTCCLLWACQPDNSALITVDIYARYEADAAKLKAEAIFYKDTLKQKKSIAVTDGVVFSGTKMIAKNLPGNTIRYDLELTGPLPADLFVKFTENEGQDYELPIDLPTIDSFEVKDSICLNQRCLLLSFVGNSISQDEKLIAMLSDTTLNTQSMTFNGPIGGHQILLKGGALDALKPGPLTIYLVRSAAKKTSKGKVNMGASTEFYTKPVVLESGQ